MTYLILQQLEFKCEGFFSISLRQQRLVEAESDADRSLSLKVKQKLFFLGSLDSQIIMSLNDVGFAWHSEGNKLNCQTCSTSHYHYKPFWRSIRGILENVCFSILLTKTTFYIHRDLKMAKQLADALYYIFCVLLATLRHFDFPQGLKGDGQHLSFLNQETKSLYFPIPSFKLASLFTIPYPPSWAVCI